MVNQPVATVGKTAKAFTLLVQCCDPPIPVSYVHSNRLKVLKKEFDAIVKDEKENGLAGGSEFEFKIFEHTAETKKPVVMVTDNDRYADFPFVYNLDFPGSKVIEKFDYMDLFAQEDE